MCILLVTFILLVPGAPPQNVSVAFTSSTSVAVNWLPVQSVSSNGIVYAYIVSIQRTNSSEAWTNVTIFEPNLSHDITGLLKYVTYSVKVLALTVKGSGPFSEEDTVRTDEDRMFILFIKVTELWIHFQFPFHVSEGSGDKSAWSTDQVADTWNVLSIKMSMSVF